MAETVNILSQAVTDEKTKIAIRQLEQLVRDLLARIDELEARVLDLETP